MSNTNILPCAEWCLNNSICSGFTFNSMLANCIFTSAVNIDYIYEDDYYIQSYILLNRIYPPGCESCTNEYFGTEFCSDTVSCINTNLIANCSSSLHCRSDRVYDQIENMKISSVPYVIIKSFDVFVCQSYCDFTVHCDVVVYYSIFNTCYLYSLNSTFINMLHPDTNAVVYFSNTINDTCETCLYRSYSMWCNNQCISSSSYCPPSETTTLCVLRTTIVPSSIVAAAASVPSAMPNFYTAFLIGGGTISLLCGLMICVKKVCCCCPIKIQPEVRINELTNSVKIIVINPAHKNNNDEDVLF